MAIRSTHAPGRKYPVPQNVLWSLAFVLLMLSLAACGGGGGGSSSNSTGGTGGTSSTQEADPEVEITGVTVAAGSEPRQLDFDWSSSGDTDAVDHYRLEMNPDGASGFTPVDGADNIAGTEFSLQTPVHLTDFVNALYRVVAVDGSDNEIGSSSGIALLNEVASEDIVGYFKAPNSEDNDIFGSRVALSNDGDTLAVGAPFAEDAGTVYVFRMSGDTWEEEDSIQASNAEDSDLFGVGVALSGSGDVLAVGAPGEDGNGTNAGAAYVFTRSGGNWSQEAYVTADTGDSGDDFGRSVALSENGEILAVGARMEASDSDEIDQGANNNEADGAGAAYVFRRSGGDWPQEVYIKASNSGQGDRFGSALVLAGDGDTLVVGAPREESDTTGIHVNTDGANNDHGNHAGAVYVFVRDGTDAWLEQAYIKASTIGDSREWFGLRIALSATGDTLAVGVSEEDSDATGINGDENTNTPRSGAVYVFTRADTTWSREAYIKASNTGQDDAFGTSVALSASGDLLAVGADREDSAAVGVGGAQGNDPGSAENSGAVYVFERIDATWSQLAYVKASNSGDSDRFGESVALSESGDLLAVGAPGEASGADGIGGDQSDDSKFSAGAVYLY